MSQQVDLEELTRLYDEAQKERHVTERPNSFRFAVKLAAAFPALRDELVRLREIAKATPRNFAQYAIKSRELRECRAKLDEAKGLLSKFAHEGYDPQVAAATGAFLASLAGSEGPCLIAPVLATGSPDVSSSATHQQEQPTQGEACLHNWQLSQGAVVYKCTKCGDKTTAPPQEVEGGEG